MIHTSVIIPVRNGSAYVAAAVNSALPQLSAYDELIVVDDASADDTLEKLEPFLPRIKLIKGPGKGPSIARNLGIAAAEGTHVAFLDHDDLWPAGRQTALLKALGVEPDALVAAQGRTLVIAEDGVSLGPYAAMQGAYLEWQIMSMLCPAELIRNVGGFAEDMHHGEDIDLGLRLLEAGMVVLRIDADAWIYRRHSANATNDAGSLQAGQADAIRRKLQRSRMKR